MTAFLVDEDLPRSLAKALREAGHDAVDVRDVGLRGAGDAEIADRARAESRVLASADLGFSNILRFPLGSHPGMVIARLPNELPAPRVVATVTDAIARLEEDALAGSVLIIEPGRERLRRRP